VHFHTGAGKEGRKKRIFGSVRLPMDLLEVGTVFA